MQMTIAILLPFYFIVGCDLADNTINAIHQSRKVICLMSRAYLKSEWCIYGLKIVRVEAMLSRDGNNIVIIVHVDNFPAKDL